MYKPITRPFCIVEVRLNRFTYSYYVWKHQKRNRLSHLPANIKTELINRSVNNEYINYKITNILLQYQITVYDRNFVKKNMFIFALYLFASFYSSSLQILLSTCSAFILVIFYWNSESLTYLSIDILLFV